MQANQNNINNIYISNVYTIPYNPVMYFYEKSVFVGMEKKKFMSKPKNTIKIQKMEDSKLSDLAFYKNIPLSNVIFIGGDRYKGTTKIKKDMGVYTTVDVLYRIFYLVITFKDEDNKYYRIIVQNLPLSEANKLVVLNNQWKKYLASVYSNDGKNVNEKEMYG